MRQKRRRWWIVGSLVLLIILAQFNFFNPVRDVVRQAFFAPERVLVDAYNGIKNSINVVRFASSLSSENASLKNQLLSETAEVAKLQSVQAENVQLRQDLHFTTTRPDLQLTPAEVIGYSPLQSYNTFTINKGQRDGLVSGKAVISQGYLIGVVGTVSSGTAEIRLLTNRSVLVPVTLTSAQTTGLLSGGISGLVVSNIPLDTKVTVGDLVVTSNLEGQFPAGIAVGTVQETVSKKEDIFLSVRASSPINTSALSQVYVVTN